jgi:SpoVK/Ycf46/Vps4 family AAA+-type ATPase
MNYINLDSQSSNIMTGQTNANIMSPNTYSMFSIQNMIHMELFNKLRTGDPIIDAISGYMVFTFVVLFCTKISNIDIFGYIKWIFFSGINFLWNKIILLIYGQKLKTFEKTVEISYITDDKKINELYKAVHWHISNSEEIDYLKETPIKFTYEDKISLGHSRNIKLNKHIVQNRKKEILFKNFKINYSFNNELITIYSDKDRKRENYKISLSTSMNDFTTTDIIEEFCIWVLQNYIKSLTVSTWTQLIYVNENDKWTSRPSNNFRKLDTIILQNELKEDIKKDLQLFLNSEDWYKHRDIPYTRGHLFYGLPGSGKTSLIKGLSNHFKRHIHFLILSNIKDDFQLIELLKSINYKETILVIEDIDCMNNIVKSRELKEKEKKKEKEKEEEKEEEKDIDTESDSDSENKKTKSKSKAKAKDKKTEPETKLTLSGLLNAIDGVFNNDGRMLIMTTNKPEVLDEALIRQGRIDKVWGFFHTNHEQIKKLYEMFYEKPCPTDQLKDIKQDTYSPAHLTAVFLRYREDPENALKNIDKISHEIKIESLISQREQMKYNSLYQSKGNSPNIGMKPMDNEMATDTAMKYSPFKLQAKESNTMMVWNEPQMSGKTTYMETGFTENETDVEELYPMETGRLIPLVKPADDIKLY